MALDMDDMVNRLCSGEGDPDVVRILAEKLEEAGNFSFAAFMLSAWADHTPFHDVAWAYKRSSDFYVKIGNKGMANLAMRKARRLMLTVVGAPE